MELFEKKVFILENSPELILTMVDTCNISKITNKTEATDFLLLSLAKYYTSKDYYPPKELILKSIFFFEKYGLSSQQLEALYLLARIYGKEKRLESEVATVEKAIRIAKQENDTEWLFHLYSYLGDMYIAKHNVLRFIKYQTLANQCAQKIPPQDISIYTKIQIAKSMLYIGKYNEANNLLNSLKYLIKESHICYSDYKRLQGIILFKQGNWQECISKMKESLVQEDLQRNKFVCYSILAYCYYHIGDLGQLQTYRKLAISNETEDVNKHAEVEFYKLCAEFGKSNGDIKEQLACLHKVIDGYEYIIKELNSEPLSEAIQSYTNFYEKTLYEKRITAYQYCICGLMFVLFLGVIIYINQKKKQAYRYLFLQQQIKALEGLKAIQEDARLFVLKDFEIAKKIAILKQTRKEQSSKFLKELDKFSLIKNNPLLATQWDKFYHHINLSFDNFYSKLIKKYPSLNEKELQLCCMLMAGFKTEEIAAIWMQSVFSVHKYKTNIRKKIQAPEGANIINFLSHKIEIQ